MGTIRVEADGASEMSHVQRWLTAHRGQEVGVDTDKILTLGAPIIGARAVIIAAVLNNGVGGVLRALTNLGGSVRFVFDIRARAGLNAEQVKAVGTETLDAIARHIAKDEGIEGIEGIDAITQVA
ncbi:MAG TPA: hypothetical protein VJS19_01525 [Candidatus Dormibacteraeota bacterium]|nr:hypothetical protein [Candidatus Dormibacteraeota bacterium]